MSRSLLAVVASLLLIPSAAEAGSITGRVLDVRGRPFASVNIEIVAADESPSGAPEQTPLKRISGSAKSDGVFRIQLPGDWPPSEIRVSATGTVRRRAFGVVTGADDLDLGLLTLPAAQVLQGIVRDESGRPIAGVLVRAIGVDSGADVLPGEGATDAAGRYVIVDAPQRVAQMILTHSDCVSQSAPSIRSTWVLRHGGAIEGIVVDDRGRPASQVRIGAADQVAVSSALGSFRLAGLAPGISHVLASDDEGGVAFAEVLVVDRDTVAVTLALHAGSIVRGTVRDVFTGRPVGGTRVRAYTGSAYSVIAQRDVTAVSSASGRFRIVGLEPSDYVFEAQRPGYLRSIQKRTVARTPRPLEVEVLLTREAGIEGRVTDISDRPIAGAYVSVAESNPMQELARQLRAGRRDAVSTYSDDAGRFVLRGLWPGRALRLEAFADTFVPARIDGIELAAGTVRSGLILTLHAGTMATGLVTDQQDRPLANVNVYSTRIKETDGMGAAAPMLHAPGSPAAVTDNDGRYVLSGLEQGRYFQRFVRQGYSSGFMPATHIAAGTINELPPVRLGNAGRISGRVVDQQHRPLGGASIFTVDQALNVVAALADANGEFEMANLTEGDEVSLQVESDSAAPGQIKVRVPATGVTIQLSDAVTVRGRVYDAPTREPVTDFSVERIVRSPGTTTFHLGAGAARPFHSEDGTFELSRLPPGPCVLRVRSPGYQAAEIAVPALPTTGEIAVPMIHGAALVGRVLLGGSLQAVPNATITWRQGDASRAELEALFSSLATAEDSAVTDAEGRFVLENVPSGAVTLFASHAEYAPTRTNVTVPTRSSVEVLMNSGGTLAGIVMLDRGGVAAGASVAITAGGERGGMLPPDVATTDASGRFRFGHLRPGSYTLVARASTGASLPYPVGIVASEQRDDLVLTLKSGTTIRGAVRGLEREAQSNVFVMAHGEGYYDSTYTDAAGTFTLPHVPAGTVALEATTSFRHGLSAAARVDIPEDGTATIDVDIEFGGLSEITGVVVRAGRPASSVLISATPVLPRLTTRGRAESEADGSYRIQGLSDGQYFLVFSGPHGVHRRTVDVRGSVRLDVDLPSGSITGTVTDATSHGAIADAIVTAVSGGERIPADAKRTVTDSAGHYVLADLDPGTYQVRATRSGYQQEMRAVTVQDREELADLELQPQGGIRLRILDASTGGPISRANVRVTAQGVLAFADTLMLDNAGRGDMPALPPGNFVLTVLVAGYAPRSMPVQAPIPSIDVLVEPGGRVQLGLPAGVSTRVRLIDAVGIAQAVPGSDTTGWTAIAGPTTVWPNVAAGSYRLESMTGGVTPLIVKTRSTVRVEVK